MKKVFNQVKENIPQNKRDKVLCAVSEIRNFIRNFGVLDAPHTCEQWDQIGAGKTI